MRKALIAAVTLTVVAEVLAFMLPADRSRIEARSERARGRNAAALVWKPSH